jgi:H+-transporting ATPase
LTSIALVAIIIETDFFQDKFGVELTPLVPDGHPNRRAEDPQLHMIAYLQVAVISQALIFVTRSHGFFFMERPSLALLGAFVIAQLISSIIAAYADWGFTTIHSISAGWIGIVWVWVCCVNHAPRADFLDISICVPQNIVWFVPLDWIKFAMKATVIKWLRQRSAARTRPGIELTRTTSRVASIHESLYSNRVSFIKRAARKVGFGKKFTMRPEELQRFSSIQAHRVGETLARHPSRTANV